MNADEKKIVTRMVSIYCRLVHGSKTQLCDECDALLTYAHLRLERCPFEEEKPTCASCPVHCYKPDMRQKIKEVMRTAGPRMLFLHPIDTIKHFHKERQRDRHFVAKEKSSKKTE
ncbi:MAG: nitrous oxide-stimulated promoter family protein [Porphyromonadaceae bacterium]|nr:nitrous oxide-stimulated promoter family protein [Porphyromonadaceae bacterium]